MKFAAALAATTFALLLVPSLAQAQQRPAQGKPAPAADAVRQAYAALPEADRIAIQDDLIWTGDFNGTATADFGPRAIAAVKAFQKRLGGKDTGVLNPKERGQLSAAAKRRRDTAGWRMIEDAISGMRIGIPYKHVWQHIRIPGGSRWTSGRNEVQIETFRLDAPGTTLQAIYEGYRKIANRKIAYNVLRGDFFVISGLAGTKKFYIRGQFKDGEVRGFSVLYDQAMDGLLEHVVVAMAGSVQAFPSDFAATPPPRRKVEYGTAVFMNTSGDAITTRELIEECQVITLSGFGPADLVAQDAESGLALLRIFGAQGIKPLGIAGGSSGTEATLVGIADPARQGGGHAASSVVARLVPGRDGKRAAIVPVPALGFGGAAAVDREGRLLGLADMTVQVVAGPPVANAQQATLIPAAAIKAFLAQQNVATADTPAADGGKAALARVICVRK